MKFLISYLWLLVLPFSYGFLAVQKGHLVYNNERVFLSGVNTPWVAYGKDFGSGAYKNSKPKFEQWLTEVAASGGNVVRVWVHVDGHWSPKFDANGFATGADVPSLVAELGDFLNFAEKHNIFVILCLWNLAVKPQQMIHLYTDEAKLNSYLEKVLKPMVAGLKHHKALAAYDIINEPGGSIKPGVKDANPCWDTQILTGSGADWAGSHLSAKDVARFINHHADAIKAADPKVLITVGDGEQTSSTICGHNCREFWSDHCLVAAGGKPKGVIDIIQFHSYTWQGKFSQWSPMKIPAADYKLNKPIFIGEMAIKCSESKNPHQCFSHAYDSGYAGILSWGYDGNGDCSDGKIADEGMKSIKNLKNNGVIELKIA